MDIFRFTNPIDAFKMEEGEIVNGLDSKMWIERYVEAGEFTLTAKASTDIMTKLPVGSYISHVNSTEIMKVEDHGLSESKTEEGVIQVTGRGLEAPILEGRVVGSNKTFPVTDGSTDYEISANELSEQCRVLIRNHISTAYLVDDDNAIPYLELVDSVTGTQESIARTLKYGDLYSRLIELLNMGTLGIKIVRPGNWSPASDHTNTALVIHKGVDRTKQVAFSHASGEIERADYLWSDRKDRNAALIIGKWVETTVVGTQDGVDRRWMIVEASDIDQAQTAAPTGGTLTSIVSKMQQRGRQALAKQKNVALSKAEISRQSVKALYRTDYDLGDLVAVEGNYNEGSVRRVTEYVEIEDGNGRSAYPTLSEP